MILVGLVIVLLTGVPVFAGLTLFATGILLVAEGRLGGLGDLVFGKLNTYLLVAIPLFTLMAHFMIRGKVVDDLFGAAHTLLRHLPGGMGVATVAACTVFAAISGSSVATALTIGSAAIPLMIRYGYSPRVAYGVVGGGGTLGILIPPSGPMVLFGVVSDTSIGARRPPPGRPPPSATLRNARATPSKRASSIPVDRRPSGASADGRNHSGHRRRDGDAVSYVLTYGSRHCNATGRTRSR